MNAGNSVGYFLQLASTKIHHRNQNEPSNVGGIQKSLFELQIMSIYLEMLKLLFFWFQIVFKVLKVAVIVCFVFLIQSSPVDIQATLAVQHASTSDFSNGFGGQPEAQHLLCVLWGGYRVSSRGSKEQVTVADCEVPPCFILSGRAC